MRQFPPGFAEHIAQGETTLATCWRLTRADGVVLGFTDHDRPLVVAGTRCDPVAGFEGGEASRREGGQVETSEIFGVLDGETLAESDILDGRFDGAEVETFRVNWERPDQHALLRRDTIGEIVREDGRFRAELRSPMQALNRRGGRVYQPLCDAVLGDGRCRAPIAGVPVTVVAIEDGAVRLTGAAGPAAGWFALGTLVWTTGRRAGLKDEVTADTSAGTARTVVLERGTTGLGVGDRGVLRPGCDKRLSTCAGKFGNAINFRGFPHVPGSDYVLRHPRSDGALDGRPVVR